MCVCVLCLSQVHLQNREENIVEVHKPDTHLCHRTKSAELHHDLSSHLCNLDYIAVSSRCSCIRGIDMSP